MRRRSHTDSYLGGCLFGAGFAVKILWWVAIAVLILWLIGFAARPKGSSGRW
ncbi:hydrophobic protein [Streptomyces erythrochromogenes]|uniref:hydrophobic protein n=1 Tax=Streptomyces erythrochromogenes TaxID=285574 RepID=UPI0036F9B634